MQKRPAKSGSNVVHCGTQLTIDYYITFVYTTVIMKTVLNSKVDADLKREAQKLAKELGVPLSLVVNGSLREFVRNREVVLSAAPRMSPWLEQIIGEFEEDRRKGKGLSPAFSSAAEALSYLKSRPQ